MSTATCNDYVLIFQTEVYKKEMYVNDIQQYIE